MTASDTNQSAVAARTAVTAVLVVVLLAALLRIMAFNGVFGSDDIVYYRRALEVAQGVWSSSNYNGALRYGFNIPAGIFIWLFGTSAFAANLWSLLCSLIEIAAVFAVARHAAGLRAGLFAAVLLAAAPLHIAVATRIHADPVVAAFVSCSFALLYFGLQAGHRRLLWWAGISIGAIFWSKELAAVTWFAFLPLLVFLPGRWKDALPVIAGVLVMLALNGLLMFLIAGDPLHAVKVVLSAMHKNFIVGGDSEDSPAYYLRYLFVDLRHVGLLGWLALASLLALPWLRGRMALASRNHAFVVLWCLGLLAVLSLFPVSLSPLRFTMKQSNYISLFLAPLALLAGLGLAALSRRKGIVVVSLVTLLGILLGFLQQADYRAFTANGKALVRFAQEHPGRTVVVSKQNDHIANFLALAQQNAGPRATVVSFRELHEGVVINPKAVDFVVLDPQTQNWSGNAAYQPRRGECWKPVAQLQPEDLGMGNALAGWMATALSQAGNWSAPIAAPFVRLAKPTPSQVYAVVGGDIRCGSLPDGAKAVGAST